MKIVSHVLPPPATSTARGAAERSNREEKTSDFHGPRTYEIMLSMYGF